MPPPLYLTRPEHWPRHSPRWQMWYPLTGSLRMSCFGLLPAWRSISLIPWQRQWYVRQPARSWCMKNCIPKWNISWLTVFLLPWMARRSLSEVITSYSRMNRHRFRKAGRNCSIISLKSTLICIWPLMVNWQRWSVSRILWERKHRRASVSWKT